MSPLMRHSRILYFSGHRDDRRTHQGDTVRNKDHAAVPPLLNLQAIASQLPVSTTVMGLDILDPRLRLTHGESAIGFMLFRKLVFC
jgi:hypothetical protein